MKKNLKWKDGSVDKILFFFWLKETCSYGI